MSIQITGSWDLTGSFTASQGFFGTASYATTASYALNSGGGGGGITLADISTFGQYFIPSVDYVYTASATLIDIHVSESAIYELYSPSGVANTNVNVYFHLDDLPEGANPLILFTYDSGAGTAFTFRNILVNPTALSIYQALGSTMNIGTTSGTVSRNASAKTIRNKTTVLNAPNTVWKYNNVIYITYLPYFIYSGFFGPFNGTSYGTPLT